MSNLRLKGSIWHWRITVPHDLCERIGKRELGRSTGTGDKRIAQRISMRLTAEAKQRFEELRRGKTATPNEITAATRQLLQKELTRQRLLIDDHRSDDFERLAVGLDVEADIWRDVLVRDQWSAEAREVVDGLIVSTGVAIEKGTAQYETFSHKVARAMVQVYVVAVRQLEGDYAAAPWDDLSNGGYSAPPPRASGFLSTPAVTPRASEMFRKWLADKSPSWAPGTAGDYKIGFNKVFLDVVGDVPVGEVTIDDIRAVRDAAQKLPSYNCIFFHGVSFLRKIGSSENRRLNQRQDTPPSISITKIQL